MQNNIGDILHQQEIKELIGKIRQFDIAEYGSNVWFSQDESLQKLNMQLHVNAIMKNDEFLLEECVTQDKFKILIYDLILTSTWKQHVLPLLRNQVTQLNSLKLYLAIYHQAVICNMLEVLMFHRTAIDQSGDFLIEIIDYAYRKMIRQISENLKRKKIERENERQGCIQSEEEKKEKMMKQILKRTPQEELDNQVAEIQFSLFIMSISILRYVTDYVKHLEIGIVHHLLIQCNLFSVLVPLIEERPWLRLNSKGEREIFENTKWNLVPKSEYGKLPKTEAQVWIAIYNLFMDPECRKKYELNDQRKNTLLRLRKYMNEVLLDQIPALSYMLRSLEQLSMMNVPTHLSSNPLVVQQMAVIESSICKNRNWKELALDHHYKLKQSLDEDSKLHIQRLADLYTNNNVEGLIEGFKCKKCTKEAFKRCSKCKNVWYCSKECQVTDWPDHKISCNLRAKQLKEAEQNKNKKIEIKNAITKPLIDELD